MSDLKRVKFSTRFKNKQEFTEWLKIMRALVTQSQKIEREGDAHLAKAGVTREQFAGMLQEAFELAEGRELEELDEADF